MTTVTLNDGDPFIYMKVGIHAKESLADIIKRKREEIAKAGVAFWGYGGGTCHPLTAVRPFVTEVTSSGTTVRLLMQEINSKHYAEQVRANSYSENGIDWKEIPKSINVLGSRYALVLSSLEEIDLKVALDDTKVGVGRLTGTPGSQYIRGRVDKACLVFSPGPKIQTGEDAISLRLAANLADPFAVLLK